MREKFKLGFLPTRRVFFSKEDSNREKVLISEKIRTLAPEIEIVGLEGLNEEALLITEAEALEAARRFRAAEVDAVFAPHCNFGSDGLCCCGDRATPRRKRTAAGCATRSAASSPPARCCGASACLSPTSSTRRRRIRCSSADFSTSSPRRMW